MKARAQLPRFSPFAARCFETVFLPLRNMRLGEIRLLNQPAPETIPPGRPVLLVGNHVSNWDGFLFREAQRRLRPDWPIFSVMLEKELAARPLFRRLGGIGIDPASPASIAKALRSVRALRAANPEFFLSYFPQGDIYPSFKRPLGFLGGVDFFVRALAPLTVIPVGMHMEPMQKLAPTFFVCMGRPMRIDRPSQVHRVLESLVEMELDGLHARLSAGMAQDGEAPGGEAPGGTAAGKAPAAVASGSVPA
ncbi:MAG: lysophospholipid acyltransferase family protein [Fibrobacteria bacterium]